MKRRKDIQREMVTRFKERLAPSLEDKLAAARERAGGTAERHEEKGFEMI